MIYSFSFSFYSGVSAIQKLCAVNTSITVKSVAVNKKHIKGTSDTERKKIAHAFHENTLVCVCEMGEKVPYP